MRKIWTKSEEKFIKDNIASMNLKAMAIYFDVPYSKINDKVHKMGLNRKKSSGEIWSQKEDDIIKEHFEYAPKNYITRLLPNRTWSSIWQRGSKTFSLKRLSQDKIDINYKFFQKWTEFSAYAFGIILSDGHIHKGDNNYLQIEMNADSLDILQKLALAMEFKGHIYHMKNRNTYKLQIRNTKIIEDLINMGIPSTDKTNCATINIDLIPKEHLRHVIRGIIDGDGWSYFTSDDIYNLGLCGTEQVVTTIKKSFPFNNDSNHVSHYEKNCWRFNFKSSKAFAAADWLYNDSHIFLNKKYNAYLKAKTIFHSPS